MPLQDRISTILNSAETHAATSVNSAHVLANWLIGREIIIYEQEGKERATYGEKIIPQLAKRLKKLKIKGYATTNLWLCRQFHQDYPCLLKAQLPSTLVTQFHLNPILHAVSGELPDEPIPILYAVSGESQN